MMPPSLFYHPLPIESVERDGLGYAAFLVQRAANYFDGDNETEDAKMISHELDVAAAAIRYALTRGSRDVDGARFAAREYRALCARNEARRAERDDAA